MTNDVAIGILLHRAKLEAITGANSLEFQEAVAMAVRALKKETPCVPALFNAEYFCPNCGKMPEEQGHQRCDTCGQRLDWEGVAK